MLEYIRRKACCEERQEQKSRRIVQVRKYKNADPVAQIFSLSFATAARPEMPTKCVNQRIQVLTRHQEKNIPASPQHLTHHRRQSIRSIALLWAIRLKIVFSALTFVVRAGTAIMLNGLQGSPLKL